MTYIRREADWATRAAAEGRLIDAGRMLPVLPATVTGIATGNGNGHGPGGNGHAHGGGGSSHAHHK